MGEAFRTTELETLFNQTRQVLDAMRASGTSPEPPVHAAAADGPQAEEITAEALDGKVRVTMAAGRLQSLWIEPRAMRFGSEELCEHVVAAVNAALDQASQVPADTEPLDVDPVALSEQLRSIQEQSLRQMSAFGDAMSAVVARLDRSPRT